MEKNKKMHARWLKIALAATSAILLCALFYQQLGMLVTVLLTGCILAFLLSPLCDIMAMLGLRKRALSVVAAFLVVILLLAGLIVLLLPPLFGQIKELSRLMARSMDTIQGMLSQLNHFLEARGIPAVDLGKIDWSWLTNGLMGVLNGTKNIAGSMIGSISRFGLSLMLAFYFLLYKEQVLLSAELMIPSSARKITLQMCASVIRELRQYIKGQLTIALIVGVIAGVGLALVRAPSPLLLGAIVGIFNLIPYFGPLIGGIPTVLMALGQGLPTAALSALVLFIVQQLDGFLISPRVMSGMMGISPTVVLLAIIVGSTISGVSGMFFAIPVLLIVRICLRVWASRNETIEKFPEM